MRNFEVITKESYDLKVLASTLEENKMYLITENNIMTAKTVKPVYYFVHYRATNKKLVRTFKIKKGDDYIDPKTIPPLVMTDGVQDVYTFLGGVKKQGPVLESGDLVLSQTEITIPASKKVQITYYSAYNQLQLIPLLLKADVPLWIEDINCDGYTVKAKGIDQTGGTVFNFEVQSGLCTPGTIVTLKPNLQIYDRETLFLIGVIPITIEIINSQIDTGD